MFSFVCVCERVCVRVCFEHVSGSGSGSVCAYVWAGACGCTCMCVCICVCVHTHMSARAVSGTISIFEEKSFIYSTYEIDFKHTFCTFKASRKLKKVQSVSKPYFVYDKYINGKLTL